MHPIGDSTTSNNRWLWWLAIFISQLFIAASRSDLTLEEPLIHGNDFQQVDLKSAIREEPSHQASLMAGNRTPGPSDAPCLVETSTAHGELLLWITASSIGSLKLSWLSFYALNLVQQSPLPSPELSVSLNISQPPPYGRRSSIRDVPTKVKLGFPLVGSPKIGPITLLKPMSKRCNPNQILSKPRSVPYASLSIFSHTLCSLSEKIDRRHQFNRKLPSLPWMFKNFMRTLLLDSPRSISYESQGLKKIDIRLPISRISWSYKEDFENLKRDPDLLSNALKHNPYRTVCTLLHAGELLCLAPLVMTRISAMELSLTSSSLLTVTITSSIASLVDEPSITLAITCAKLPHSLWLQALKEPLSNYVISLFLNFASYVPLLLVNLGFVFE